MLENSMKKCQRLTEAFKTGAFSCGNQSDYLVTDAQSALRVWRKLFFGLLKDNERATLGDGEVETPIDVNGRDFPLSDFEGVGPQFLNSLNRVKTLSQNPEYLVVWKLYIYLHIYISVNLIY